ncbi:hypothetical protein [Candidatus Magnetominusculus xianensis]|uniref:Secreted protein n=1 Tax=Candidatus Magnetominusculus xianensis TaxID=1748249 RepID=A0ABR5SH50_9BACT|nr:hypothetical protein [Candidatus Magnetominusculus xianensis]KWT91012.1 hypothetical protein ASN18_0959 [Candidatus Magnetominusculus xianensis]MBF0402595.1 hypothetical protein [Nitrospirota bacterium]
MLTGNTVKTLIIVIMILFALSTAEGDGLYCVSLKKDFKISNKIHYSIMSMYFDVTNAEIYSLPYKPEGWMFDISKSKNGSGSFGGCVLWFPGGIQLNYFYDDFAVIKKKPGVNSNKIELKLEINTVESLKDNTDDKDFESDKSYKFKNDNFNIRRCEGNLY